MSERRISKPDSTGWLDARSSYFVLRNQRSGCRARNSSSNRVGTMTNYDDDDEGRRTK